MSLIKTNHPGYLVDNKTNVVINTNERELLNYRKQVEQAIEIRSVRDGYDELMKEVLELKRLMTK